MLNRCREYLSCGLPLKLMNALAVLVIGAGILILTVGLFTDAYSWQMGVVGLVALWVIGFSLRVFLITPEE